MDVEQSVPVRRKKPELRMSKHGSTVVKFCKEWVRLLGLSFEGSTSRAKAQWLNELSMTMTMRSIDQLPVIDLGCLGSKLVKHFEHSQGSQIDHYILDQAIYLRLHRMSRQSAYKVKAPLLSRYCVALHIIVLDGFAAAAQLSTISFAST